MRKINIFNQTAITFALLALFGAPSLYAATVEGSITDDSGQPIANIYITLGTGGSSGCAWNSSQSVNTDNLGKYSFSVNTTGTYYIKAAGSGSGYGQLWWNSATNSPDCNNATPVEINSISDTITSKDFTLYPEATITGLVTSNGTPLANVPISANIVSNPCYYNTTVFAFTNDQGIYTLNGLSAESYILISESWNGGDGYITERWATGGSVRDCNQAEYIPVQAGDVILDKNFQLEQAGKISGKITDAQTSAGIAGIQVNIMISNYNGACGWGNSWQVTTDTEGNYTFNSVTPGEYYLIAYPGASDYIKAYWKENGSTADCNNSTPITVAEGQNLADKNLSMQKGSHISGKVLDVDTLAGLNNVQIKLWSADLMTACQSYQADFSQSVTTDDQGNYSFRGLPTGEYYFGFESYYSGGGEEYIYGWWGTGQTSPQDCFDAQKIIVTDPATPVEGKDLLLKKGASISGTVTDAITGLAVDGVNINANQSTTLPGTCTTHGRSVSTNANGEYTIGGLVPSDYTVSSYDNRYVQEYWSESGNAYSWDSVTPVNIPSAGATVIGKNFVLDPAAFISGTITNSSGQAVSSINVSAFTGNCENPDYSSFSNWVGSQGKYSIKVPVTSEQYYVVANFYYNQPYLPGWWNQNGTVNSCQEAQKQTVSAQGVSNIDITLSASGNALVSGHIYNSSGTPLSGKTVMVTDVASACDDWWNGNAHYRIISEADGAYEVSIPPGSYYIFYFPDYYYSTTPPYYPTTYYSSSGGTTDCNMAQQVTVTADSNMTGADIFLIKGGIISGAVYNENDHAISGQSWKIFVYDAPPCSNTPIQQAFYSQCYPPYMTPTLPPGEYYLGIGASSSTSPSSYWSIPGPVNNCAAAKKILLLPGRLRQRTDFYRTQPFGDANNDGIVDLVDIIMDLDILTGGNPEEFYLETGDWTEDGNVDMSDIIPAMGKAAE